MPLVFVHGVANRPTSEQAAEIAQRNELFRAITFRSNPALQPFNPDWGSAAVAFGPDMRWLPDPDAVQTFAAGGVVLSDGKSRDVGLGSIAKVDGAQAVDLAILAVLEEAITNAGKDQNTAAATDKDIIRLAVTAADYLQPRMQRATSPPAGIPELVVPTDRQFADALDAEFKLIDQRDLQAFGIGDKIREAVGAVGGWIGNGISDAALRWKRRSLSQAVALFLGDIFVYLRQRKVAGSTGTAERLFEPILKDLVLAARAKQGARDPLVVVGHSLGGVLLYDILTDKDCTARLEREFPGFKIDALLTVGSQPGFFADLGMYPDAAKANGLLKKPGSVTSWLNVYDFTDVFSFLCEPFFEGVDDFGYDTAVDLFHAHSAYFKRPSFYKRLELRLKELGHL